MSDAEIARLKGALQATAETAVAKDQECRRLTAEIERLLAANRDVMLHWDVLKADYEQLRSALEDVLSYVPHGDLPLNPYDKARAALDGQPAPSPWRPIETAPKDGSRMLLAYQNSHQKWRRVIAFYAPKLSIEANDDGSDWCEYDEPNDRYCLPEGWYECIDNWDDYSYVHIGDNTPSHWMPLPPAPKKEDTP